MCYFIVLLPNKFDLDPHTIQFFSFWNACQLTANAVQAEKVCVRQPLDYPMECTMESLSGIEHSMVLS